MQLEDDFDEEEVENKRVEKNRPNHYGAIPGKAHFKTKYQFTLAVVQFRHH